jgi:hypothetical protein
MPSSWRQCSSFSLRYPIAQEPVVANAVKSTGENVEEESSDELLRREGHGFLLIVGAIVPPAEFHLPVFDIHEPMVGNKRRGGCIGRRSPPLAAGRRRAAWRIQPIRSRDFKIRKPLPAIWIRCVRTAT